MINVEPLLVAAVVSFGVGCFAGYINSFRGLIAALLVSATIGLVFAALWGFEIVLIGRLFSVLFAGVACFGASGLGLGFGAQIIRGLSERANQHRRPSRRAGQR